MRKQDFCTCENKDADQLRGNCGFAVTAKLISAFVFVIRIEQFLYYLNPKFPLWLYSPVVSDLVGNPKTGFLTTRLISSSVYLPDIYSISILVPIEY